MSQLILTAVGPDRPGLVADLTRHVHESGASLADSRMVNLRGHFALLALVEGEAGALERFRSALSSGSDQLGLKIDLQDAAGSGSTPQGSVPYRLKSYSMDQPGIVARISSVLQAHGVNVEELETRTESAPFAGTPLFLLEAVVSVPKGTAVRKLRDDLLALGDTIGCDVDLDPA
jgi:glycine cleavage system transcriptional repressor